MCFVATPEEVIERLRLLADGLEKVCNAGEIDITASSFEDLCKDIVWVYIELDGVTYRKASLLGPTTLRTEILCDKDALVHSFM